MKEAFESNSWNKLFERIVSAVDGIKEDVYLWIIMHFTLKEKWIK